MASEEMLRESFSVLRPVCVALTREHSLGNIRRLCAALDNLDPLAVCHLQEYILFPLRLLLKQPKQFSEDVFVECVDAVSKVLAYAPVHQFSTFRDILSSLCQLISLPTFDLQVAPVCEELKLATVRSMQVLLSRADSELLTPLYAPQCMPLVGHAVSVLLAMAQSETMRSLRTAALNCLLTLLRGETMNDNRVKAIEFEQGGSNSGGSSDGFSRDLNSEFLNGKRKDSDVQSGSSFGTGCDLDSEQREISSKNQSSKSDLGLDCHRTVVQESDDFTRNAGAAFNQNTVGSDSGCNQLRRARADAFTSFLPGVVTAATRIISGDTKLGQVVICAAISVWSAAVTLVMNDDWPMEQPVGDDEKIMSANGESRKALGGVEGNGVMRVRRTEDWRRGTVEKLRILVERLAPVAFDVNWKVRLAMVRMSTALLLHCTNSLQCCLTPLLDIVVRATTDDFPSVQAVARSSLARFQRERLGRADARGLLDVLEESVYRLATQLPRLMAAPDDAQKLSSVSLLKGYIQLLGRHVDCIVHSDVHLRKLSSALLQVLQFDCSFLQVVQEKSSGYQDSGLGGFENAALHRPKYHYVSFVDSRIEQELGFVCSLLGCYGDAQVLVDHFLELFRQSAYTRKQAAFCLNRILSGVNQAPGALGPGSDQPGGCVGSKGSGMDDGGSEETSEGRSYCDPDELEALIRSILDEYLQPGYWPTTRSLNPPAPPHPSPYTPPSHYNSRLTSAILLPMKLPAAHVPPSPVPSPTLRGGATLREVSSAVVLSSLLLEGVGRCALVLGVGFQPLLVDALYPLLVRLGADNARIAHSSLMALRDVAHAVRCRDVVDLLRVNCDYVVNDVSLRLRRGVKHHPDVTSVLCVVLRHSDAGMLPLLVSTMHEILDALDHNYEERTLEFLRVFQTIVCCIAAWHPAPGPAAGSSVTEEKHEVAQSRGDDLVSYITEYHRNKLQAEDFGKNNDDDHKLSEEGDISHDEHSECEPNAESEAKQVLPDYIALVKQVLERCQHLLISLDPQVQLLVLDIVDRSCGVMKPFQSELLPLIHKLWKPFVQRFSDREPVVVIKAFETLQTMVDSAGDFMHRRVVTDILPRITDVLDQLAAKSMKAGPAYKFSANCRLQLSILNHLGDLCRNAAVEGKQFNLLLYACLPYLSARQPTCLQQACMDAFRGFIAVDGDSVWLLLTDVYCSQNPLRPPFECLPPLRVCDCL